MKENCIIEAIIFLTLFQGFLQKNFQHIRNMKISIVKNDCNVK